MAVIQSVISLCLGLGMFAGFYILHDLRPCRLYKYLYLDAAVVMAAEIIYLAFSLISGK